MNSKSCPGEHAESGRQLSRGLEPRTARRKSAYRLRKQLAGFYDMGALFGATRD
jgi:hypothetical protein